MKIKIVILGLLILLVFVGQLNTSRKISINYEVTKYELPLYVKILDFINRHNNYKFLTKSINNDKLSDKEKIIYLTNWVNLNIKKIEVNQNIDIVDNHPITIIERRLAIDEQFSDILSVLLVYSDIDSFFKFIKTGKLTETYPLTFFKINNYWSIIDPQYGVFFVDEKNNFIDITNLKDENWDLVDTKFQSINNDNHYNYYKNRFNEFKEIKLFYSQIFLNTPTTIQINSINKFKRGGRSYVQDPLGRLNYEIFKFYNTLIEKIIQIY